MLNNMDKKERLKILNIPIDTYNINEAIEIIDHYIKHGKRSHSVFASNPEKNFSILNDEKLYHTFTNADLLIPDGIGMVIAARILKKQRISRVPGIELMDEICKLSYRKGYGIYVYGAKEEINKKAVEELEKRYMGIKIVGRSNGYVNKHDMINLIRDINDSNAKVLFLALGSPRQEKWFADHKDLLGNIRVCQGIGGTLDVIAGKVKRAPDWWRKNNLEWLYRLINEPARIKRQKILPRFLINVIIQKIKNKNSIKI
jgi:N-acetylglucosaminyldiphosphoundecaprenol N-acetyl-beta-D-mannosaminyltransferase